MTIETTTETAWVYDSDQSPQAQRHRQDLATARRQHEQAKATMTRAKKPSEVPADMAAINVPMAGARGAALDRDIQRGAELERLRVEEHRARARIERIEKCTPVPFTREQLRQACGVTDKNGTAYGLRRVNGKTITVTWDGNDSYRWELDKIYRVIPKAK